MNITDILTQLMWPETKPANDQDRARAREVLVAGATDGRISVAETERRQQTVVGAATRNDIYQALRGLDGAPPEGLRTALRVTTAVWLLTTVVQLTVWLAIATVGGNLDAPWWLYSTAVGGVIVGLVWAANEAGHGAPRRTGASTA